MGGLLAFYQQRRYFDAEPEASSHYLIEPPLLVFIGDKVSAGSAPEVLEVIRFLDRVCRDTPWAVGLAARVLGAGSGLTRPDGADLFADQFPYLASLNLRPGRVVADLRRDLFLADSDADSGLSTPQPETIPALWFCVSSCAQPTLSVFGPRSMRFVTLAHELAHLYLGHLGADAYLNIKDRRRLTHPVMELEAESVASLVSHRRGITAKSQSYLAGYVSAGTSLADLDLYELTKAAGQIEDALGIAARTLFAPQPCASSRRAS